MERGREIVMEREVGRKIAIERRKEERARGKVSVCVCFRCTYLTNRRNILESSCIS